MASFFICMPQKQKPLQVVALQEKIDWATFTLPVSEPEIWTPGLEVVFIIPDIPYFLSTYFYGHKGKLTANPNCFCIGGLAIRAGLLSFFVSKPCLTSLLLPCLCFY